MLNRFFICTAAFCSFAFAGPIVNGTLHATLPNGPTTMDRIYFNVGTAGVVTIDMLAWEHDNEGRVTNNGINEPVDLNGDGDITVLDTDIFLFLNDGLLDVSDFIDSDDDSPNTYGDGSIFGWDSFLSANLPVGNYILIVSPCCVNTAEAIAGTYSGVGTFDGDFHDAASADYRATFTGDVTITSSPASSVPEPGTFALLALPLAGIWLARRRRNA